MQLHDHQIEILDQIELELKFKKRIFVQMPTGTGKTVVIAELIRRILRNQTINQRILIIVHRTELIEQTQKHLSNFGIKAGTAVAGNSVASENLVVIGMVQVLAKTNEKRPKNVGTIIIDEAHHTPTNSYKTILDFYNYNKINILGFSATPERLDKRPLSEVYESLIQGKQIAWYIENGYLAHVKHFATSLPELDNIKIDPSTLDFDRLELSRIMRQKNILAEVVQSYKHHTSGKKAIIFAVNQDHAEDLKSRFQQENISSEIILSKTSKEERTSILYNFRNGKFKILINVTILTEGFDSPDTEVVILARPTKSVSLYLQMIGRVTRISKDKKFAVILDNASNWLEHGLVSSQRIWSLNGIMNPKRKRKFTSLVNSKSRKSLLPHELLNLELIEIQNTNTEDATEIADFETLEMRKDNYPSFSPFETMVFFVRFFNEKLMTYVASNINTHYELNRPCSLVYNFREIDLGTILCVLNIKVTKNEIRPIELQNLFKKHRVIETQKVANYDKNISEKTLSETIISVEAKLKNAQRIQEKNKIEFEQTKSSAIASFLNTHPQIKICQALLHIRLNELKTSVFGSEIDNRTNLSNRELEDLFSKYFDHVYSFNGKYEISKLLSAANKHIPNLDSLLKKLP